jgi:hypothetical protein
MWNLRLLGEVSTKREVMPEGRGMGGREGESSIVAERDIKRVYGKTE